jgi:hypothetical protein
MQDTVGIPMHQLLAGEDLESDDDADDETISLAGNTVDNRKALDSEDSDSGIAPARYNPVKWKLSDVDLSAEPGQVETRLIDWQNGHRIAAAPHSLLSTLRLIPPVFWIVCLAMMSTYGTVIPFNTIHAMFLQQRFQMDPVTAGQIMAVPDTISMLITPFTGHLVDRYGRRV